MIDNTERQKRCPIEVFEFLKEHPHFKSTSTSAICNSTSYYFSDPSNRGILLFMDIPNDWNKSIYVDELFLLGYADWFDELYYVSRNIYQLNQKKNKEKVA